ncbi:hypothetical protein NQ315_006757 [Exocentrus adspersus]|uniref:Cyclic nucleotide-binding domain-containing protein n=1 Tax=Exocentrus adspersus TaxID=1586481 RepID=A0AAV8WE60_9CUCU|nr:hypothetical protein NQ315_006757 [Exocentrus adspersus]
MINNNSVPTKTEINRDIYIAEKNQLGNTTSNCQSEDPRRAPYGRLTVVSIVGGIQIALGKDTRKTRIKVPIVLYDTMAWLPLIYGCPPGTLDFDNRKLDKLAGKTGFKSSKTPRNNNLLLSWILDVEAFERLLGPCMEIMKRNITDYEEQMLKIFGSKQNMKDIR